MAEAPLRPLVLDASVVVKWYVPGEDGTAEAVAFQDAFLANKVEIIMPDVVRYEVANALHVAERRKRIDADEARQALLDFLSWDFNYVGTDELLVAAMDTCGRLDCALYDALYLTLADSISADFVTADRTLVNKAHPTNSWAKWLGDF
jgi:predicted nucleic acid-binding protein